MKSLEARVAVCKSVQVQGQAKGLSQHLTLLPMSTALKNADRGVMWKSTSEQVSRSFCHCIVPVI